MLQKPKSTSMFFISCPRFSLISRKSFPFSARFLIAKALVHKPRLLLLDEPSAGVDVELRETLWVFVRELHQAGTAILLTTHYIEEAEQLSESTAVIDHGKLIAWDSIAAHPFPFNLAFHVFHDSYLQIPRLLIEY